MNLLVDSEGPDQTARMCRLIWAFAVCIGLKICFFKARPKCNLLDVGVMLFMEQSHNFAIYDSDPCSNIEMLDLLI